jgi:hypothetical protein
VVGGQDIRHLVGSERKELFFSAFNQFFDVFLMSKKDNYTTRHDDTSRKDFG